MSSPSQPQHWSAEGGLRPVPGDDGHLEPERLGALVSAASIRTPPSVCGSAEINLAHRLMRRHRECRIHGCVWKWVAYRTLVYYGRIAPQTLSPRERAHRRGIEFPTAPPSFRPPLDPTAGSLFPCGAPEPVTLHQVLDGLRELARDMRPRSGDSREG